MTLYGCKKALGTGSWVPAFAGADLTHSAGADLTHSAVADLTHSAGANLTHSAGANLTHSAGADLQIRAAEVRRAHSPRLLPQAHAVRFQIRAMLRRAKRVPGFKPQLYKPYKLYQPYQLYI